MDDYRRGDVKDKSIVAKYKGLLLLIAAGIAVWILFRVSAPLGFAIYLLPCYVSFRTLRKEYRETARTGFIIWGFDFIRQRNFFREGAMVLIVAAALILFGIAIYRWIVTDTIRETNALIDTVTDGM